MWRPPKVIQTQDFSILGPHPCKHGCSRIRKFLEGGRQQITRNVFPQEAGPFQIDVSIFSPALVQQQPRSQGSLLRALRSEREREILENTGHVAPEQN